MTEIATEDEKLTFCRSHISMISFFLYTLDCTLWFADEMSLWNLREQQTTNLIHKCIFFCVCAKCRINQKHANTCILTSCYIIGATDGRRWILNFQMKEQRERERETQTPDCCSDDLHHPCLPSDSSALTSLPVHSVSTEHVCCSLGLSLVIESRECRWRYAGDWERLSQYTCEPRAQIMRPGCKSCLCALGLARFRFDCATQKITSLKAPSSIAQLCFTTAAEITARDVAGVHLAYVYIYIFFLKMHVFFPKQLQINT